MGKKERFSLRKYKVGLVSVLIGAVFLAGHVAADEVNSTLQVNQVGIEQAVQVVDSSQAVDETQVELAIEQTSEVSSQTVNQDGLNLSDNQEASLPTENEVTDNTQDKISTVSNETLDSTPQQEASQAKQPETPQSIDTDEQIKVPEVWESGYKGQGTVVAIIDSGLDVDHDVLHITDPSKAKYKSQEEMDAAKAAAGITYGKWFNDKVIFGYNYVDGNTNLKEGIEDSHGMHVTGIAAGNPTQKAGDEYIYGVAPEAQVIFLRVFSDLKKTTGPALYVRAIEDAVKLGADSINLSLGSTTGSTANIEESLLEAIEAAQRAGVTVVISAGNDGAFGDNQKPFAENIDYGLVGNPSTAKGAISVASYNSDYTRGQAITFVGMENNADLNYGRCPFSDPNKSEKKFEIGRDYDYVYVGTGTAEEVQGVDLTGKIALIKRGGSTFSEKIAKAIAQGAEGVVIYNNDPQGANISMSLDDSAIAIPAVFIPYKFGNALANGNYKIRFSGNLEKFDNIEAGHFSSFSSWGLTSDGELKPDVSAPGGSIYSSFNDGQYGLMSGTSMAAPHVTGVVALVKQYLKEKYPEKSDAEIAYLVKALIMSNAKAHYDEQAGEFSSPRQQGAGLVDTASAISSGLYLTSDDGYGSITLGNVGDTFNFDVTIHNISDQDKTLTYETNLQTDAVEDGKITLSPRHLASIAGRTITVKANSSEKVMITVDARQFAELLTKEMPNGYYLEGFVRFLDSVDFAEVVSLPFVGFRGDFQNLAVVEDPVYKLVSDGKEGFYLKIDGDHIVSGSDDTTALLTNSTGSSRPIVLGTYANNAGDFVLHLDENGTTRLAISPNNDGKQDFVTFKGVFLRNYTDASAAVYAADDVNFEHPLWQSETFSGVKNYKSEKGSTALSSTIWYGDNLDGKDLSDGSYKYVLTYYPTVIGAQAQHLAFDIIVDRKNPVITTATYDAASQNFNPRKALDDGSGVLRGRVYYIDDHHTPVYLEQNPDGSFTLPLDAASLENFYYVVEDFAGNTETAKVSDLVNVGNESGRVTINLLDDQTNVASYVDYTFIVKDHDGNVITDLKYYGNDLSTVNLPFGDYTVELALYDTDAAELAGPTSQIIKLSDADSYKTVNFYVHMRNQAALVLDFDKELPKGTTVSISNKNGKLTVIPAARYAKKDYGKNVYVGDYTLELPLPVGYELYEDPHFTVVYGKQNHIAFSIIDKIALIAATQAINGIENEARYYNASLEKLLAYRDSLTSAQAILSGKYTQVEVDAALQTLQDAIEALDGKTTDFKALTEEDSQFQAEQEDPAYYNAGVAARTTYDTQHRKANLVLAKGSVTQEEVDATLKKLKSAREALDGKATDFRALSNLSNKSKVLKVTSAKYKNASEPAKTAYDQALVEAQAVLSNSEATQGEVDAALANLKAAEAELDGKEKQTTSTQTELNDFIPKEVIKSETPPQSMRTQSASEKGGEVVALGVNKRGLAGKSASALKQSKETAYLPTTSSQSESFLVSLGFIILAGVSLIWKNRKHVQE